MQFRSLIGNERLKSTFERLSPSTVGTAIIIEGPSGAGKKTAAYDIAKAVLCTSGKNEPCMTCGSCVRMGAGSHPDFHRLTYSGKNVKVEEVRALRARTFLKPDEGIVKVFVLEAADKLTPECQNVLLKVLEQPHSSIFLLLCENRYSLLQTVRSRCTVYTVEPLEQNQVLSCLLTREVNSDEANRVAALCGGSVGRALSLLENAEVRQLELARDFVQSLSISELSVLEVCFKLSRLGREDYMEFCDEACRLLCQATKSELSYKYITVFEYLKKQKDLSARNISSAALSGALAAVAGQQFI